jgi:WD40 repeat protein/energy-coupling factor transporter ATP-binding protein EcfA2
MLNQPFHNEDSQHTADVSSNVPLSSVNPFPGLRPFSIDDTHLFFGREHQIDDILLKVSKNRFITIMGYSGSGKSSLLFCGLVPIIYGGFVTESGPNWNVITTRPGKSPISNLTESVIDFMLKTNRLDTEGIEMQRAIINSVLRSGSDGLIKVSQYLQRGQAENAFFLIDQFEEIFGYQEIAESREALNDAQLYVNLLLTAIQQNQISTYVALTMRSDFIGECSVFAGLTEQINNSNYLVPQMSREQKRSVIEGPIAVAGGKISQRLVKRLLNDIGNTQDQLPIFQHALMRTWDYWIENHEPGESMDIRHYNAIGKISTALAQHANEAYEELSSRDKEIAEILFKNITERSQQNRFMRRPCRLGMVAELAEASEADVISVIDHFRSPGRSFLMPAANVPLHSDSMIELSHESLMRIWTRLETWVNEEYESASMYKRLSEAASMYQIGKTGLWRPPDLQLALNWQKKQKPTREWGQRYDEAFERAVVFLDTSRITYDAELKNQEMMQRRVLRRTRATAVILGIAFIVAIIFFVFAYLQKIQADQERLLAEANRQEAIAQSKIAEANKLEAERKTIEAENFSNQLQISNDELKEAYVKLTFEKNRAELAFLKAKEEESKAIAAGEKEREAKELAELKSEEAQLNYRLANKLYMLAVAQNLATKSVQEDDDNDLKGLMAMQGYIYNRRYEGKVYEPYIYNGLYSALKKINGTTYNAMKINGPSRVHLRSLAVSAKNGFYISGADGRVYQGDLSKLTNTATPYATQYPSKVIALSKDETYLVNGSDSSFIQIYDLKNGNRPKVVKGFSGPTNDIEFLPNNDGFIVSSGGKTLSHVDQATGVSTVLATLPYELKAISISADGKWLAGAAWSGQVVLFNLETKSMSVIAQDSPNRILSVQFSPSGKYLAYGVDDITNKRGLVKLYDFNTKETRQFSGHRAGVNDVAFSPDEKLLASAGADKRLQMYVLENPEDLPVVMDNNSGFIWDIEFAQGSNYLIAACSESEIRIWPTNPSLLAEQICPKLTRNMTQEEWKKYVGYGEETPYENTCVRLLIKDY